ncbi:MAG: hypothetical protein ACI9FB_004471 [Candidatus Azotimanducaceae bacterium]|jgi:hypothetical protein
MLLLDHIMYAYTDLDKGIEDLESLTGVKPLYGGVHVGKGTRNALFSLGNTRGVDQYFEAIAPDPEQNIKSELVAKQGIKTWAVASNDLSKQQLIADSYGYKSELISMSREIPGGDLLQWKLLFISGHGFPDQFPFFIDWLGGPNPSLTTPLGCELQSFKIRSENSLKLSSLLEAFDIGNVDIEQGPSGMFAILSSPEGKVIIS